MYHRHACVVVCCVQLELAANLDMKPIITHTYALEGDGLSVLLAYNKVTQLLSWGDSIGERADSLPNVAALLRAKAEMKVGLQVYEYFEDSDKWFKGEVVAPRQQGLLTVKYSDNKKIDQEEREVRQWVDVREMPEWNKIVKAVRDGIKYLRNRLEGNLPLQQRHYDCSVMWKQLRAIQVFDPSWAVGNMTAETLDELMIVTPIRKLVPQMQQERHAYLAAAAEVTIDHTESGEDHTFTDQVLKFFRENHSNFPAWAQAARIVFAMTPNSAAAERVFSHLKDMFGDNQTEAFADYIQTAVMLKYNKRPVG